MPVTEGVVGGEPRVAVVTGASTGVGRAVAVALGGLGWTVALGARRVERLEEAAFEVRAAGGEAHVHALDVTDPESVDNFFVGIERSTGRVADVLVNNAGVGYLGAIGEASTERLRAQVDTNLLGVIYCTRRAVSALLAVERPGDLVFISSDSIETGYPHMLTYGATKAAVEYLAAGLDVELGGTGIRTSTIRLGPTVSEFNASWSDEDMVGFMQAWDKLGLRQQDFNYIPVEVAAQAVVTAVTTPPGSKVSLISVRPEVSIADDRSDRWSDAATQGRADDERGPDPQESDGPPDGDDSPDEAS